MLTVLGLGTWDVSLNPNPTELNFVTWRHHHTPVRYGRKVAFLRDPNCHGSLNMNE